MKKIAIVDDSIMAGLLQEILEEEGIPYSLQRYEDSAYGNLYLVVKGWGEIWGNEEDEAKIKEILEDILNAQIVQDPEFTEDQE